MRYDDGYRATDLSADGCAGPREELRVQPRHYGGSLGRGAGRRAGHAGCLSLAHANAARDWSPHLRRFAHPARGKEESGAPRETLDDEFATEGIFAFRKDWRGRSTRGRGERQIECALPRPGCSWSVGPGQRFARKPPNRSKTPMSATCRETEVEKFRAE